MHEKLELYCVKSEVKLEFYTAFKSHSNYMCLCLDFHTVVYYVYYVNIYVELMCKVLKLRSMKFIICWHFSCPKIFVFKEWEGGRALLALFV